MSTLINTASFSMIGLTIWLTFHRRWSCVGLLQQNTWLACLCPSPPPEHLPRSLFHTPGLKPWWWPWPSPLSPAYDPSDRPQFLTEGCGRQTASCSWSGSKYRVSHHSSLGLCRRQPERWSDRLLDRTPHPQPSSAGVWQWHGSHGHGPSIHSTGGVAGRTTPQCTHCCCLQILSALQSVAARDVKRSEKTHFFTPQCQKGLFIDEQQQQIWMYFLTYNFSF